MVSHLNGKEQRAKANMTSESFRKRADFTSEICHATMQMKNESTSNLGPDIAQRHSSANDFCTETCLL